jgi:hypothetical protein
LATRETKLALHSIAKPFSMAETGSLANPDPFTMTAQDELNFGTGGTGGAGDGYNHWLAQRQQALLELARKLNLPLNHQVEIWLAGGIRLRGKLQLQEATLFVPEDRVHQLRLQVDRVPFSIHEMESCVRLD